jgi:hypothetical protein
MVANPNFNIHVLENNRFTLQWKTFLRDIFNRIAGSKDITLGGVLNFNTTAAGNVGTGEDDLLTYTIDSNILSKNGDIVEIEAMGVFAANANNKTLKLHFGSETIFSTGAIATNGTEWNLRATIIRYGASLQRISTVFAGDTVLVTETTEFFGGNQDTTSTIEIKCTGEATSNDDIVQRGLVVKLYPAL